MAELLRIVPSTNEVTLAEFSRRVRMSRERAAALHTAPSVAVEPEVAANAAAGSAPPARAEDVLTELVNAVEQLQVAEEELRVQSEALSEVRDDLERERQRYQELFDFAPDAYLVTDAAGTIREANVAAARLLGIPRTYLAGKPLINFVDADARRAFRTQLDCLCGSEQVEESTLELRLRDGERLPIAVRVAATRDRGGRCSALRWSIRDVTGDRALEQRARRVDAEIERRVRERTLELTGALEREREARAEAERTARAGAELTARLTRELRRAIETSTGYAELIRTRHGLSSGAGGELQRAAADSVLALHEYMLGLVADAGRVATCAAAALSVSHEAPAAVASKPAV